MFELNGYWQKVGGMTEGGMCTGSAGGLRKRKEAVDFSSVRATEKYLTVPTFIRLGRKVNEMCGLA